MTFLTFLWILIALFVIELLYFKVAQRFQIIDQPNHRSSHHTVVLRGGGIIFSMGAFLFFFTYGYSYPFFMLGLFAITFISFLDDILTLSNKLRLAVHLLAVMLLLYQLNLLTIDWYFLLLAIIIVIGTINAYNFMDGINGITGGYSLVLVISLFYINNWVVNFTSPALLIVVGAALLVFNFFNFRKRAKCFAGDVGSVSIAFIVVFLVGQLLLQTQNFSYVLLLLVYGLDTVTTIVFRKIRKENVFEAHRSHFYQYLANQLKWYHLSVSTLYMGIQLLINIVMIFLIRHNETLAIGFVFVATFIFVAIRFQIEGKSYLLKNKQI